MIDQARQIQQKSDDSMTHPETQSLNSQIEQASNHLKSGNRAAAEALVEALAGQAGIIPEIRMQLAKLCIGLGDSEAALAHLQTVLDAQPKEAETLVTAARCLGDLNQHDRAIAVARLAMELDAQNPNAWSTLGGLLVESGDDTAAQAHFQDMIGKSINLRLAYTNLARLRKYSPDDQPIIEQAEEILASDIPSRDKLAVHFALGKILDDCRQFEQAFSHFQRANQLQQEEENGWNGEADQNWFNQIQTVFSPGVIARLSEMGNLSEQPVFIVGMPRTGTTLMERLIASHSQGAGAGELLAMPRIAHQVMRENENKAQARALNRMGPDQMAAYAEHYLQALRLGQSEASRIVDKLPGNYQNLGLIHCLFPRASIIHAVRHPLDTCLSCYFQAFAEVRWSNDLSSVASTYRLYRDYMDYWKKVLPRGKILDVHYESLVEDPAAEGQKMLEHCGLSWEEQSLDYHQQQAVVRTVSHAQVRQPIYQSSKMRWVNYASQLQDLVVALSDYLEDDKSALAEHDLKLPRKKRFGLF